MTHIIPTSNFENASESCTLFSLRSPLAQFISAFLSSPLMRVVLPLVAYTWLRTL
eukprot:COSAG02_NODE_7449_length_3009_cov_1.339519_1_plen_54_part_10